MVQRGRPSAVALLAFCPLFVRACVACLLFLIFRPSYSRPPAGTLAAYPRLTAYTKAFFELPKIKEYVDANERVPVNNNTACLL